MPAGSLEAEEVLRFQAAGPQNRIYNTELYVRWACLPYNKLGSLNEECDGGAMWRLSEKQQTFINF